MTGAFVIDNSNCFAQANSGGFPSSRKAQRASERHLADRTLEVQDYGGTQQVAIQQGDTMTVIQQDPFSSQPKLEVHDGAGVQTASKYKPLDTPGISVSKGGQNDNTLVHVGDGDAKQTIELLRTPGTANAKRPVTSSAADIAAAHSNSSQVQATLNRAKGLGIAKVTQGQLSKSVSTTPGTGKSSFHGGGTTLDSVASSNVTERASEDQKQAMAATDRQRSSSATELFSSSTDEEHPKDPASRESDSGYNGALASAGSAAAAAAAGLKGLVSNTTEVLVNLPRCLQMLTWSDTMQKSLHAIQFALCMLCMLSLLHAAHKGLLGLHRPRAAFWTQATLQPACVCII